MIDFKIQRGPSGLIFSEPGVINPRLIIEEGCWYLCTDTAELFLGVYAKDKNGQDVLTLKQINGTHEGGSAEVDLTGYAKLTDIPDVSEFITNAEVMALIPEVPTKVSELENDAKYITAEDIPETDLSNYYNKEEVDDLISDIEHPTVDLTSYATKEDVAEAINGIEIPDVSEFIKEIPAEYITEAELEAKKYLTEHQDISGKADKEHTHTLADITDYEAPNFTGYATEEFVTTKIAEAELADKDVDLTAYYTKSEVDALIPDVSEFIKDIPTEYITEEELTAKGYLTEHQSLEGYAKVSDLPSVDGLASESYVDEKVAGIVIPEIPSLDDYAKKDELFSKDYNDLTNKPKLFDGDYNSLTNVPEIPVVPTNVSAFTNDAGYLTQHQDISHLATKEELPSLEAYYTKSEVAELIPDVSGFIKEVPSEYITETELAVELNKIKIPEAYDDSALRELINSKAASEHTHDEYALTEHTHDEYLTEHQSLAEYAKKSELFSKDYNDLTNKPTIPSIDGLATEKYVDDAVTGINIPDVSNFITMEAVEAKGYITAVPSEYVTETELNDKGYLTQHQDLSSYATKEFVDENYFDKTEVSPFIAKVTALETFKTDVTTNYATKQYVTDAIETHEGIAKRAEVEEVKTKLETEIIPVVTVKADEVPFTDSTIVKNQLGGFTVGEDIKGLTIAELFAKLLGFANGSGETPDEPDVPGDNATPEEILEYLTAKNASIYVYDESDQLVQEPFTEPVAWTPSEASVRMDGVSTKYTIKDGDTVVEAGYQQATTYSDTYWLTVALPSEINNIKVKMYEPDISDWVEPLWHMVPATEQTIDGYTVWVVPEDFEIDGGATYRFVIVD